jgi:hypothetical protein
MLEVRRKLAWTKNNHEERSFDSTRGFRGRTTKP